MLRDPCVRNRQMSYGFPLNGGMKGLQLVLDGSKGIQSPSPHKGGPVFCF